METDNEVELGEKLQPPSLLAGQEFHSGEVLQILMVGDDVVSRITECRAAPKIPATKVKTRPDQKGTSNLGS